MAEPIDLKQIERNVFRDYMRDGLVDILFGTYFSFIGFSLSSGAVAAFIVFPVILFPLLLRRLKERFTYPRTGYVSLREGEPQAAPWIILGSFVAGLVVLVAVLIAKEIIAQPGQWYRWIPLFFGVWMAGTFVALALRVGLVRYYVDAGLALAAGPASALLPLPGKLANIALFFGAWGAVVLAWGVIVFLRFLHAYPLPTEGTGDVTG
jgi:hypothetical protein